MQIVPKADTYRRVNRINSIRQRTRGNDSTNARKTQSAGARHHVAQGPSLDFHSILAAQIISSRANPLQPGSSMVSYDEGYGAYCDSLNRNVHRVSNGTFYKERA